MFLTIAAFILVLGVLIFVHEAGHFIAAKAVGIQVLRFSLGFGKPLVLVRRGETEYVIATIPLGGYVKMAGLEDEGVQGELEGGAADVPVDPARAFDRKPVWARMIVILAGVSMNFLLAVGIFGGLATTVGERHFATALVDTVVVDSLPPGAARALVTLRPGDSITTINGRRVQYWEQVVDTLEFGAYPVSLGVAGRAAPLVIDVRSPTDRVRLAIAQSIDPSIPAVIEEVSAASPASRAGFEAGDRVVGVDTASIRSWTQFTAIVRAHAGDSLMVRVQRAGREVTLRVVPDRRMVTDPRTGGQVMGGYAGVAPAYPEFHERVSLDQAVPAGVRGALGAVVKVVKSVQGLANGRASVRDLGGPIAIADMSGRAARLGLEVLLGFIALLSVNLAVLNLLPIPVLDGGQFVFLVAEGLRRRPLSLQLRLRLTQFGFVFIVLLMTFVIGNDLLRYVFHR